MPKGTTKTHFPAPSGSQLEMEKAQLLKVKDRVNTFLSDRFGRNVFIKADVGWSSLTLTLSDVFITAEDDVLPMTV